MDARYEIVNKDCLKWLGVQKDEIIHLTFIDPPFRQGKDYRFFDDSQDPRAYWNYLEEVLREVYRITVEGGVVYFMQREKNTEAVLRILREAGWTFQNLIIWKKKTSAVPSEFRYSKQYQIIAFATRGTKPRVFNRLRIDLPVPPEYKYERNNGVYLTDVWDDIKELTSGYFAGDEAIRNPQGERMHKQQSPIALLLRIILSSTLPGDTVLDPFSGTGTTAVVSNQLERNSISIEIDPAYVKIIEDRLMNPRRSDSILKFYEYYRYTKNLKTIWHAEGAPKMKIPQQARLV
ncbi:MAG: DNA-methyltransferase [Candidatus Syntropharchaeales archaeon]